MISDPRAVITTALFSVFGEYQYGICKSRDCAFRIADGRRLSPINSSGNAVGGCDAGPYYLDRTV